MTTNGELVMRVVHAEASIMGLRRALRRLVAAEHQFVKDTGIKLDDLIAEAVQHAEIVLEHTKKYDLPSAAKDNERRKE